MCRAFKDIAELKGVGLTLAVVKYRLLEDHWVTVIQVTDQMVVVADPLAGINKLSHEEFEHQWRFMGIVLERETSGKGG